MGIDTDAIGRPYAVSPRLQAILGETEATLRGIYGDRFLGLVLSGSHARGTAAPGSDIDLVFCFWTVNQSSQRSLRVHQCATT